MEESKQTFEKTMQERFKMQQGWSNRHCQMWENNVLSTVSCLLVRCHAVMFHWPGQEKLLWSSTFSILVMWQGMGSTLLHTEMIFVTLIYLCRFNLSFATKSQKKKLLGFYVELTRFTLSKKKKWSSILGSRPRIERENNIFCLKQNLKRVHKGYTRHQLSWNWGQSMSREGIWSTNTDWS